MLGCYCHSAAKREAALTVLVRLGPETRTEECLLKEGQGQQRLVEGRVLL